MTPFRDGMNLVAKEYVAAQNEEDPGVLILSKFAGAAEELEEALIVNPYNIDDMAKAMQTALRMPLEERKERHAALLARIETHDVSFWRTSFLDVLSSQSPWPGAAFPRCASIPTALAQSICIRRRTDRLTLMLRWRRGHQACWPETAIAAQACLGDPDQAATAAKVRDLALFNLAIDRKLRGCDLVSLKVEDIAPHGYTVERTTVRQRKQGGNCRSSQTHGTAGSRTGKRRQLRRRG